MCEPLRGQGQLPPPTAAGRHWLAALLFLLAVAGALRFYHLGHSTLWYDEFCSLECSTGRGLYHERVPYDVLISNPIDPTSLVNAPAWWHIWTSLDQEQHPPLYLLLLRAWRIIFGESDFSYRSVSALAGCAAVWLLYELARTWFGTTAAFWSAAMMAVAAPMVDVSVLARGYTLMLALVLATMVIVARMDSGGVTLRRLMLLATLMFAAMLTHYFALAPCVAIGGYTLLRFKKSRGPICVAFFAIALIYAATWGPFLWAQRASFSRNHDYLGEAHAGHWLTVLQRVALFPARCFNEPQTQSRLPAMLGATFFVLPFLLAVRQRALLLPAMVLVSTVGLIAGLDLWRDTAQLTLFRYLVPAAPMVYLIIAALGVQRGVLLRHALPALATIAGLFDLPKVYLPTDGNWRGTAAAVRSNLKPGDALIIAAGARGGWYANWLYLGVAHYLHAWPGPIVLIDQHLDPIVAQQLADSPAVYLQAGFGADVTALLPNTPADGLTSELFIGGLYRLRLHAPATAPSSP